MPILLSFLLGFSLASVIALDSRDYWQHEGRVDVASGAVDCGQIIRRDGSRFWECRYIKQGDN